MGIVLNFFVVAWELSLTGVMPSSKDEVCEEFQINWSKKR